MNRHPKLTCHISSPSFRLNGIFSSENIMITHFVSYLNNFLAYVRYYFMSDGGYRRKCGSKSEKKEKYFAVNNITGNNKGKDT